MILLFLGNRSILLAELRVRLFSARYKITGIICVTIWDAQTDVVSSREDKGSIVASQRETFLFDITEKCTIRELCQELSRLPSVPEKMVQINHQVLTDRYCPLDVS